MKIDQNHKTFLLVMLNKTILSAVVHAATIRLDLMERSSMR